MSISLDPDQVPPARAGTPVACFRFFPPDQGGGEGEFAPLAAVKCTSITRHEGGKYSVAEFEYVSQNAIPDEAIITFEEVLPIVADESAQIVRVDDRIVVAGLTPDGDYRFLFDGFCTSPGSQWSHDSYDVNFKAVGVEARCWDAPLLVRWERDCVKATDPTANVACERDLRFNPKGKGNCSPEGFDMIPDVSQEELDAAGLDPDDERDDAKIAQYSQKQAFAVFMDENFKGNEEDQSDAPRPWTLANFARYVLAVGNQEDYAENPDLTELDALLDVYTPKKGMKYIDIEDSETYDKHPIVIKDVDITTMAWPEALASVLDVNGFSMTFRLDRDGDGNPKTYLDIYKKQDSDPTKYKDLYLDEWGAGFEVNANNLAEADMQHDTAGIFNKVTLRTEVEHVEASFVLAPLFPIEADDVDNRKQFLLGSDQFEEGFNAKKYRDYGMDEVGEEHWDLEGWEASTDAPDLSDLFPPIKPDPEGEDPEAEEIPTYVARYRPAKNQLNTRDRDGMTLRPKLHISVDYDGPTPAVWDGESGTWFEVPEGRGWRPLKDRLGIRVTAKDPNAWNVGPIDAAEAPQLAGGEVRQVEWLSEKKSPDGGKPGNFFLMLTCVVEGDVMAQVVSERRPVSPTEFEIEAVVDTRNEYIPRYIYRKSWTIAHLDENEYDVGEKVDDQDPDSDNVIDFDHDAAQQYCDAKREAHQLGKLQIRASIPRLTNAYEIGDRIRKVDGRDCSFVMNLTGGVETSSYPKVVGIVWNLDDGERTQLILSDVEILRKKKRMVRR